MPLFRDKQLFPIVLLSLFLMSRCILVSSSCSLLLFTVVCSILIANSMGLYKQDDGLPGLTWEVNCVFPSLPPCPFLIRLPSFHPIGTFDTRKLICQKKSCWPLKMQRNLNPALQLQTNPATFQNYLNVSRHLSYWLKALLNAPPQILNDRRYIFPYKLGFCRNLHAGPAWLCCADVSIRRAGGVRGY